tara:strand:+ start:3677 stop:4219 length:543 start_codon:yes stop_codon:yes gene_type:complete
MIFLSFGSNLSSPDGALNRFENINYAINILYTNGFVTTNKSSFYETPSYPDQKKPKFINAVTSVKDLIPRESDQDTLEGLISMINLIENMYGRKRDEKNEPRSIDIDIIDINGQVFDHITADSKKIKVPHERMALRNFVLFPLREISPKWIHPITRKNIDELIDELSDIDKKSILKVDYS